MLTTQPVLLSSEVAYRREQVVRAWGGPLLRRTTGTSRAQRRSRAGSISPAPVHPPVVCREPQTALRLG